MNPVRLASLTLLAMSVRAAALTIQLDYSYDIANGGNFFGNHADAKASLEAAAADLSTAITSSLAAVPMDVFTATQSGATATFNWSLEINNPVTDGFDVFNTFTLPANIVTIYVGLRPLTGNFLGQGGPNGALVSVSANGSAGGIPGAVATAENASNAVMPRSGGPVMFTFNDTIGPAAYSVAYGALAGTLVFDNDTDNIGGIDSEMTLENYWHFELGTPVTAGQFDFYSVALHEMIHAIGFGTSETWDSKASGTTWLGINAIALNGGSGTNLITTDGHIRSGFMSTRLSDGAMQEVVMDPSLLSGTRKTLTEMDIAFLRDLNYVPEPSTAALLAAAALLLTSRRTTRPPAPCAGKSCRHS